MNTCVFSDCRHYRYTLEHVIDPLPLTSPKTIMWIGLNPSTADEQHLDPTLRRIRNFTRSEEGTRFVMTNLFAWRDTDPKKMMKVSDPVGPANDDILLETASKSSVIVCAWGKHGGFRDRAAQVIALLKPRPLFCLNVNADGSPVHPLYVPGWRTFKPLPTP